MPCRHPRDQRRYVSAGSDLPLVSGGGVDVAHEDGYQCGRCIVFVPKSKSLQGKRANRRGRTESARIAKAIGGTNHEVEGKPYDASNGMYVVQSKKDNGMFSERIWKLLQSIPRVDGKVPVLIVKDAPGPGKKVRGYAVMYHQDFTDISGVQG